MENFPASNSSRYIQAYSQKKIHTGITLQLLQSHTQSLNHIVFEINDQYAKWKSMHGTRRTTKLKTLEADILRLAASFGYHCCNRTHKMEPMCPPPLKSTGKKVFGLQLLNTILFFDPNWPTYTCGSRLLRPIIKQMFYIHCWWYT